MRPRAVLVAAAAVLAGCGGGSGAPEARPASDLDPVAFTRSAETVTGEQVELADYAEADLVVWFWAPW